MVSFCCPVFCKDNFAGGNDVNSITAGWNAFVSFSSELRSIQKNNESKIKVFLLNQQTGKCQIVSSGALVG